MRLASLSLEERLAIAQQAARVFYARWRGRVDAEDAFQEAALIAVENRRWWNGHTRSYLIQNVKAALWARLIRRRWFYRRSGKLERVVEMPLLARDSDVAVPKVAGAVHLGDWV